MLKRGKPIYTKVMRLSLYRDDADLRPFFLELETLPPRLANATLVAAVRAGAATALTDAQAEIHRRKTGLPAPVHQPSLGDEWHLALAEEECAP